MSGIWKWLCAVPLGVALTAGTAAAQRGHAGGVHAGGFHAGGVHAGGFYGGHHYYGGYHGGYWPGYHHHNGWAVGVGIGLGFGGAYYGYPYYGGFAYPYGYGVYGVAPATYAVPAYEAAPVYEAVPVTPPAVSTYVEPIAPPAGSVTDSAATGQAAPATVSVVVPSGAELWFNGKEQTAGSGKFVSDPIQPGQTKTLDVQAKWGGSTRSMRIPLKAGDKVTVDLTRP
jgi:uncharacterized protein (TIGR03000 family)